MKPLLKWAGGKTQLLPHLLPFFDPSKRYFEPFLGGGSLLLAIAPKVGLVNDSNKELIHTYESVRRDPKAVWEDLQRHENSKEYFLELRAKNPTEMAPVEAASRMIFLNKTCFNGLYRVNKKNQFNVPYGNYAKPSIPSLNHLEEFAEFLKSVVLYNEDFRDFLALGIGTGDQVFIDPPYVPVSKYADFTRYTASKFGLQDQIDLAEISKGLADAGAKVVITNSNTDLVRELYKDFEILEVPAKRQISSKAATRTAKELIISS